MCVLLLLYLKDYFIEQPIYEWVVIRKFEILNTFFFISRNSCCAVQCMCAEIKVAQDQTHTLVFSSPLKTSLLIRSSMDDVCFVSSLDSSQVKRHDRSMSTLVISQDKVSGLLEILCAWGHMKSLILTNSNVRVELWIQWIINRKTSLTRIPRGQGNDRELAGIWS